MARKQTIASLLKAKVITRREAIVLQEIRRNKQISNRDLSIVLNMPINNVTPANFSLREKNLVKQKGWKHDTDTNRTVRTWAAV